MKNAYRWLIGDVDQFPFEHRIFNFTLLLGALMSFTGGMLDFIASFQGFLWFVFSGLWIFLYYLSRFKGFFKRLTVVSFSLLIFLFLPYGWFYSNGSIGVFPYYTTIFISTMCIILTGRARAILIASTLGVIWLLIKVDAYYPGGLVVLYPKVDYMPVSDIHLTLALMGMAALIVAYSNTYMSEKARSEKYARAIEENYQQQLYYMENLEQLIYRLKSERHDFNQHLGVVYGLLEAGEGDNARVYTKGLVATAEEYQNIVNIPYSMIRAMLNYKLSSAREGGIELRLSINVPEKLNLNEYDLTIILGNLLDNAVEACADIITGPRFITLNLHYKPNYLIIHAENPVKEGKYLPGNTGTSKLDTENHGFGLKNIEYLANKHNGFMKIQSETGVFKVNIALLLEE